MATKHLFYADASIGVYAAQCAIGTSLAFYDDAAADPSRYSGFCLQDAVFFKHAIASYDWAPKGNQAKNN